MYWLAMKNRIYLVEVSNYLPKDSQLSAKKNYILKQ